MKQTFEVETGVFSPYAPIDYHVTGHVNVDDISKWIREGMRSKLRMPKDSVPIVRVKQLSGDK